MIENLFTEKYRPVTLQQMILLPRISKIFSSNKLHLNYLLHSTPGTGKTTLATALSKNYPYLYLNISDKTGVDTIRDNINKWCSTSSLSVDDNEIKVVLLDEMDGASDQFYKALRGTIEKYASTARFIGTCNYINKIPDSILSRFEVINFDPLDEVESDILFNKYMKRVSKICQIENLEFDDGCLEIFVKKNYPDFRSLLNKLQKFSISGVKKITEEDIRKFQHSYKDLYELLVSNKSPIDNYKFLMNGYSDKVESVVQSIGSDFIDWVMDTHPQLEKYIPQVLITTQEHQSSIHTVIDPTITLLSLFFSIQRIVNQ